MSLLGYFVVFLFLLNNSKGLQAGNKKVYSCREEVVFDIIFVNDESGSLGDENFQQSKQFIIDISSKFRDEINAGYVQVGVITYSHEVSLSIPLSQMTFSYLKNNVNVIPYNSGGTYIGAAIKAASEEFSRSGRDDVPKIMIVVTDGESWDAVTAPANDARSDGIICIAVGVGSFKLSQLLDIAGNDMTLVHEFKNYDELDDFNIYTHIFNSVCTKVQEGTLEQHTYDEKTCPGDIISDDLSTYKFKSNVRLCWKCVSSVEYTCSNVVTDVYGTFTCSEGVKWKKSEPECTAYPCDGESVVTQNNPSLMNLFDPVAATTEKPRTTTQRNVFSGVPRGKYKRLEKRVLPNPVDCSSVQVQRSRSDCKGVHFDGKCYYLDTAKAFTYDAAKQRCKTRGKGRYYHGLATVKTEEAYKQLLCYMIPFLRKKTGEQRFNAWLGGTFYRNVRWSDADNMSEDSIKSNLWRTGFPVRVSSYTRLAIHVANNENLHGIVNRRSDMGSYALCQHPLF